MENEMNFPPEIFHEKVIVYIKEVPNSEELNLTILHSEGEINYEDDIGTLIERFKDKIGFWRSEGSSRYISNDGDIEWIGKILPLTIKELQLILKNNKG